MIEKKKIILVGPPKTGKTTIKHAFFDNANPFKLFQISLKPTRGVNSDVYSFFNYTIGIFDLAGQENDNWFLTDKDVFSNSSTILVVFDVHDSLETIIQFLIKLIRLKKDVLGNNVKFFILIHKIDLISKEYIDLKITKITDFLSIQFPNEKKFINIFKTSISEQFFYQSYFSILDILLNTINKKTLEISNDEIQDLKRDLKLILKIDLDLEYTRTELIKKYNLTETELNYHLERLNKMGFVITIRGNFLKLKFTERAILFKKKIAEEKSIKNSELNGNNIQLLYSILNLKRISANS